MAVRTTTLSVEGVLGKDYDTSSTGNRPLTPYIESASIIVDKIAALGLSSDAELEMVERWLAAHCYSQSDKPQQSRSVQGSSASFIGQTGEGLTSTLYGQTAMRIDSSGYLNRIDTRKQATLTWLGTTESAAEMYDQRN